MEELVFFDFETTGVRPENGDRVIEVGAIKMRDGEIVDRFQRLVNPGFPVSAFITGLTGITNRMLAGAADATKVMPAFRDFYGELPLIAHNVRFDRSFLRHELRRLGLACNNPYACSLMLSRRIIPDAPRHRLSILSEYCGIVPEGNWHRALADAEAAARLWQYMTKRLRDEHGIKAAPFPLMRELLTLRRPQVKRWLKQEAERQAGEMPV